MIWSDKGPVSRKSWNLFGPEKPFVKLQPAYSVKLVFFICCKGNKNENCKISCLEPPSLCRYKRNYVTWNEPKKFRNFRETGPRRQLWFKGSFVQRTMNVHSQVSLDVQFARKLSIDFTSFCYFQGRYSALNANQPAFRASARSTSEQNRSTWFGDKLNL